MISTLVCLLAVALPFQERVEKIPLKLTDPSTIVEKLKALPPIDGVSRIVLDPTDNSIIARGTEEGLSALRKLVAAFDNEKITSVVPLKNIAASYAVWILHGGDSGAQGFIPNETEVADDRSVNGVRVTGTPDHVRELENLIPQFDVRPRDVTIDMDARLPFFNRTITSKGTVQSNATWQYEDRTSATKLKLTPMALQNGRVLVAITGGALETEVKVYEEVELGQTLALRVLPTTDPNSRQQVLQIQTTTFPIEKDDFFNQGFLATRGWKTTQTGPVTAPPESELRLLIKVSVP